MGEDPPVTTRRQMLGAESLCSPQIHIEILPPVGWDWDMGSFEGDQDSGSALTVDQCP